MTIEISRADSPLVKYLKLIQEWCETVPNPLSEQKSEDYERVVQSFALFVAERGHVRLSHALLQEGGLSALGLDSERAAIHSSGAGKTGSPRGSYRPAYSSPSGRAPLYADGLENQESGVFMQQHGIIPLPELSANN